MKEFHLQIATPDGEIFDGSAEALLVRTDNGDVEILSGHADYFATVGIGIAKLTYDSKTRVASAAGGFLSVKNNEVKLVCTTFEYSDDIDIERAEKAKLYAEEAIRRASDDKTLRLAKAKLARALNRINVAELK